MFSLERQVYFLGYRSDIYQLLYFADLFVFPSYREGLSVSLMEAKAAGLPAVVSNIRGNEDLITNGVDGFLVEPDDSISFAERISELRTNKSLWRTMSKNTKSFIKFFSTEKINQLMKNIYDGFL
ncbi:glycosyltransferase [Aerococcus urinaeequi]|uniref:glycosyltransferase n=1 Tax=Aerococcus urinaeequi TaxID=51665 RepID=UPI003D6BB32A